MLPKGEENIEQNVPKQVKSCCKLLQMILEAAHECIGTEMHHSICTGQTPQLEQTRLLKFLP